MKKNFTIGIGGAGSGTGKTTAACCLIEGLKGWGAIKCTPTGLYSSVVEEPETLRQHGKDTERFLRAGAGGVLWVQATPEDLEETLQLALYKLSHLPGIIVEGNSAIEVLRPDIVIFMAGGPYKSDKPKESALNILKMADLVIFDGIPPAEALLPEEGAAVFQRDDVQGYINWLFGKLKMNPRDSAGT